VLKIASSVLDQYINETKQETIENYIKFLTEIIYNNDPQLDSKNVKADIA
jgi:hypothetical protein